MRGAGTALVARSWFGYTAQAPRWSLLTPMGYGVIGSPTGSGPVSLGSSPGTPATARSVLFVALCPGWPEAGRLTPGTGPTPLAAHQQPHSPYRPGVPRALV